MNSFNMTCQAFLYRLYSSIVYGRIDGLIVSSNPTTALNATPFSIPGLFAIYNASFGLADLTSPPQPLTSEVMSSIRYHTVESLISFLSQVQVSRAGIRDYYWGLAAVRGLILPMYMDFINPVPVDYVTAGSSAFKSFPLIIPVPAVVIYGSCVSIVLVWSMRCILWLSKMQRSERKENMDLEAFKGIFPGRVDHVEGERELVLMGDCWWPLWGERSQDIARKGDGMVVYARRLGEGNYGLLTKSSKGPRHVEL
jgi:hypothetical protein